MEAFTCHGADLVDVRLATNEQTGLHLSRSVVMLFLGTPVAVA